MILSADIPALLFQLPDEDIFELHQAGRAVPLAVAFAAVVLKGNWAALCDTRKLGFVDNLDSIEHNGNAVAPHSDLKAVPLAHWLVGLMTGSYAGPNFRRHRFIHAIAVELS